VGASQRLCPAQASTARREAIEEEFDRGKVPPLEDRYTGYAEAAHGKQLTVLKADILWIQTKPSLFFGTCSVSGKEFGCMAPRPSPQNPSLGGLVPF
jgi:hypothetical protein